MCIYIYICVCVCVFTIRFLRFWGPPPRTKHQTQQVGTSKGDDNRMPGTMGIKWEASKVSLFNARVARTLSPPTHVSSCTEATREVSSNDFCTLPEKSADATRRTLAARPWWPPAILLHAASVLPHMEPASSW